LFIFHFALDLNMVTDLDRQTQEILRPHLNPDETLLWSGRPRQGVVIRRLDYLYMLFGLLWMTLPTIMFVSFFLAAANENEGTPEVIPVLFLVPFLLLGFYMLAGRFMIDARRRRRTVYGLTQRHALIMVEGQTPPVEKIELVDRKNLSVDSRPDGSGTIYFGKKDYLHNVAQSMPGWPGIDQFTVPTFEGIAKAEEVFAMIQELKEKKPQMNTDKRSKELNRE
jgi:hypothetical protein